MKYVAVRHKPSHTKVFWFSVPEELEDKVSVGAQVLCNTSKGKSTGRIECILDGVPQQEAEKIIGTYFPLKPIFAVQLKARMCDIYIPLRFSTSNPTSDKIKKRVDEWYENMEFKTPVIFSPEMELIDGFSAYLVARMFEHETLLGFCVAE